MTDSFATSIEIGHFSIDGFDRCKSDRSELNHMKSVDEILQLEGAELDNSENKTFKNECVDFLHYEPDYLLRWLASKKLSENDLDDDDINFRKIMNSLSQSADIPLIFCYSDTLSKIGRTALRNQHEIDFHLIARRVNTRGASGGASGGRGGGGALFIWEKFSESQIEYWVNGQREEWPLKCILRSKKFKKLLAVPNARSTHNGPKEYSYRNAYYSVVMSDHREEPSATASPASSSPAFSSPASSAAAQPRKYRVIHANQIDGVATYNGIEQRYVEIKLKTDHSRKRNPKFPSSVFFVAGSSAIYNLYNNVDDVYIGRHNPRSDRVLQIDRYTNADMIQLAQLDVAVVNRTITRFFADIIREMQHFDETDLLHIEWHSKCPHFQFTQSQADDDFLPEWFINCIS